MNKYDFIKKCDKFFKDKKIRKMFIEQIELFFKIKQSKPITHQYKVGDDVVLNKGHYLHGTRLTPDKYNNVSNLGIISSDFYADEPRKDNKKNFVSEFWVVKEKINLSDFINKYCGVTINVKDYSGKTFEPIICPLNEIDKNIQKLKNLGDRVIVNIEQNMEARYLPCDSWGVGCTIAFIFRVKTDLGKKLFEINLIDRQFDKKIQKKIFIKWYFDKYLKIGKYDSHDNDRETSIMFGAPQELIEGIIVNRTIEKDKTMLTKIKEAFPNKYICNIDGKVIMA